jgi:hypothetical protein
VSERVIAAALRLEDGTVRSLPAPARHADVMRVMAHEGVDRIAVLRATQGFLASDAGRERFVDRQHAALIAQRAGQILPGRFVRAKTLTTEEVW